MKCVQTDGDSQPVTVLSGKVVSGRNEETVEMLVPSSLVKQGCISSDNPCTKFQPTGSSILSALLLALPPDTWSGIRDEKLLQDIYALVSTPNLPPLLQDEVNIIHFLSFVFRLDTQEREGEQNTILSLFE